MTGNVHAAAGPGKQRRPYRIREFLDAQGLKMADIARQLGVTHQAVASTVKGAKNNRRVLAVLRDMGCPVEALGLPDDME